VGAPRSILDLGCGTGGLYKAVSWKIENYVAVDASQRMLDRHPDAQEISRILGDFNQADLFDRLAGFHFERIYAASSLQWAADMDFTFRNIRRMNAPVSLAIFTANTFKSLFSTAKLPPLLRSADEVATIAQRHFNARAEVARYTLDFDSPLDMLRYIKASGVNGGRNLLGYKSMKHLIANYPLDHLEFEIIYITS
jgi:malonyl-CoA O-methyltransferase